MVIGIVNTGASAQKKSPDHRSEMINQLLFGEVFTIESVKGDWAKVTTYPDHYEGYILKSHILEIPYSTPEEVMQQCSHHTADWVSVINNNESMCSSLIPPGSRIFNGRNGGFSISDNHWKVSGAILDKKYVLNKEMLIANAFRFLNTPYLWGGKTPYGMDCSGFVQVVFRMTGVELPRDAFQQAEYGTSVDFIEEAKQGDIAFFGEENENISHVGIIIDPGHIIHCSERIKVDRIDHQGIFSNKSYTHNLRLIRNVNN